MKGLLERIDSGEVLLGDGATGTLLLERGFQGGECPELLNLTRPDLLAEIAGEYLNAGADLIQTNTFGASPIKLAAFGLEEKCEAINEQGVAIVRNSVQGRAFVSASCGPSGKLLKPYGDLDPAALAAACERQIGALAAAGADIICIETMMDLEEAKIALAAAQKASSLPVMVTMTFQQTPRGFYTIMGNGAPEVAWELEKAGADIIGSNCGQGIEAMIAIAGEFRKSTSLPLIIQPNAGLPEIMGDRIRYPESPEFFGEKVQELMEAGVSIIGGCCGTTPEHIRAMGRIIKSSV